MEGVDRFLTTKIDGDFPEGPTIRGAVGTFVFLHDVLADAARDLVHEDAAGRIAPGDAPGAQGWLRHTQGGVIPISEAGRHGGPVFAARVDPDVHDGSAFEAPGKVGFAGGPSHTTVGIVDGEFLLPATHEPAVDIVLGRISGARPGATMASQ